jgi:hypothetical protein
MLRLPRRRREGHRVREKHGCEELQLSRGHENVDAALFNIIKNGKAKMPAFSGKLSDDEIKSVVRYIRGLK